MDSHQDMLDVELSINVHLTGDGKSKVLHVACGAMTWRYTVGQVRCHRRRLGGPRLA